MDKEKAKLIFDKMAEIRKIVETEPNNKYLTMCFIDNYISFNNDPEEANHYSFTLVDGEIRRVR